MNMRSVSKVSAGLALLLAAGCAPSIGTVDRTQPNAINKSQFEGIWYTRSMVVEADPESSAEWGGNAFEGMTSNLEKVRWDITEDLLIAYRSYEFVPYAEGLTDEGRDFFGAPVATYRILSHFDVQRDYNPTTGVTGNVLVENTTDRPWYERQYMRVDWSTNMVGSPTTFWTGFNNYPDAFFSGTSLVSYYTQAHEETDVNRPVFTADYFDVTNQYKVSPTDYYCAVMLLFNSVPRCGAANVKVRVSFRKVDPADDYESLYYPDVVELKDDEGNAIITNFDGRGCEGRDPGDCTVKTFPYDAAYGNFRNLRVAFDQERFLTSTGRIYQAGRFDIWQRSFNEDGSTIPMSQRSPKPIVYFGNVHFPADTVPAAQKMADAWAKPFEQVVAFHKNYRDEAGNLNLGQVQAEAGGRMYQFRVNTCNKDGIVAYAKANGLEAVINRIAGSEDRIHMGNVEQVCAAVQFQQLADGATLDPKEAARTGAPLAFSWERKGDLRFNMQNYIHQVQNGPWGVAQFAQDPENGEFIGANIANYFADAGDRISQSEVDVIQWLNGDLDEETLFRGDVARQEVVSRRGVRNNSIRQVVKQALMDHERDVLEASGDDIAQPTTTDDEDKRFARMFAGTQLEREVLVNEEILRGFAGPTLFQPTGAVRDPSNPLSSIDLVPGAVSEEAMNAASPVNWGQTSLSNPFMQAAYEFGRRGHDMAAFFDPNSAGLAEFFKGQDRDTIYNWMRTELYAAVEGHEVGHTLGLRHNFRASMDALNYRPEFWYQENPAGGPPLEYWKEDAHPSPLNPHRGNEYKYGSIMDYGFDIPLEGLHGIGTYDEAAVRFQYGQLVDVWDSSKISIPDPRKYGSFARRCGHDSDFWGLPSLLQWMGPESLPRILGQAAKAQGNCAGKYDNDTSCDSALDGLYRELVVRTEANAARNGYVSECALFYSDINWLMSEVNNLPPAAQNIYDARKIATVEDIIAQRIEVLTNTPEYDDPNTGVDESKDRVDQDGDGVADDKGYDWSKYDFMVEHGYCSDVYASFSNPFCMRWDTGWDFEESAQYYINRFDRDYIFAHYRRDRAAPWTSPYAYMASLKARRLVPLTTMYRYYLFTRRSSFEAPLYKDWAEAAYRGINFLDRIIQAPNPGTYCLDVDRNMYVPKVEGQPCDQEFTTTLGYGGGSYLDSRWTDEYHYKANRIGYYYDKLAAIQQITSSSGFFARSFADLFDRRAYSLGYLRVYLDPMVQRFNALITGDHTGYRSRVVTDEDTGEKYVRYMPLFDEEQEDGSSVREWLLQYPEIEPAWSWSLQYYALAYGIANWSSVNDYSPEFYRFTKIAIEGTPEDVTYPDDMQVITFTDPETFITYRSPMVEPFTEGGLLQEFPIYYGDRFHRARNEYRNWSIGGTILQKANAFLTNEWEPSKAGCEDGTLVGPIAQGNRWSTQAEACAAHERARQNLNEQVGFIDLVRKFNNQAEIPQ
jgi:hypothetical protein